MKPKTAKNPKGAGRNSRPVPKVAFTVRLDKEVSERLKKLSKDTVISQNELISGSIKLLVR